tara:strand:- start:451 stop:648 length:198 start_codon:yes stop_codon:yes gene_type:complete
MLKLDKDIVNNINNFVYGEEFLSKFLEMVDVEKDIEVKQMIGSILIKIVNDITIQGELIQNIIKE